MNNIIFDIFDKANIEKLHDVLETETERVTRFCLLYQGEDIFFQRCRNRTVRLGTYMYYERKMLELCKILHSTNGGTEVDVYKRQGWRNLTETCSCSITMRSGDF